MAKTTNIDRIKIATLLLFIGVSVALVAWSVWDAFSQTTSGNPLGQEYQVTLNDTPIPTNTEWAKEDRVTPELTRTHEHRRTATPRATDPFNTD